MSRSPLTEAAGQYLALGLRVIALTGKTPNVQLHRTGLHSALAGAPESDEDWDFIAGFMDHPATTGVGILTGDPFVVVDIDGEEGAQDWRDLVGQTDDFYEAMLWDARWVAKTGRGLHLWFNPGLDLRVDEDSGRFVANTGTIKLGEKLDLKGFGGYVAAPPSKHPSGHTYEWLLAPSAEAPTEVPEPLARRIADHRFAVEGRIISKAVRRTARKPRYQEGDTKFYAQRGYEALIEGMAGAAEGNRNNYLHWAAATLEEEGGIDEDFDELAQVALDAGLDSVEVKRTIRSARKLHG